MRSNLDATQVWVDPKLGGEGVKHIDEVCEAAIAGTTFRVGLNDSNSICARTTTQRAHDAKDIRTGFHIPIGPILQEQNKECGCDTRLARVTRALNSANLLIINSKWKFESIAKWMTLSRKGLTRCT